MASEVEELNQIKAKIADVHADVKAKLEQVRAEVSDEGQAAFDEVMNALDTFDSEVGDADSSDSAGPAAGAPPANPGQTASDQPAAEQADTGVLGPDNATDENGTPIDADGNPLR